DDLFDFKLTVVIPIDHVARHVRVPSIHVSKHTLLCDETCSVFENSPSFHVIPMTMAVDDVTDCLSREPLLELALKPFCKVRTDGIYHEDAFRCDQEQAVPCTIPGPVYIIGHLQDLTWRPRLCHRKQHAE